MLVLLLVSPDGIPLRLCLLKVLSSRRDFHVAVLPPAFDRISHLSDPSRSALTVLLNQMVVEMPAVPNDRLDRSPVIACHLDVSEDTLSRFTARGNNVAFVSISHRVSQHPDLVAPLGASGCVPFIENYSRPERLKASARGNHRPVL